MKQTSLFVALATVTSFFGLVGCSTTQDIVSQPAEPTIVEEIEPTASPLPLFETGTYGDTIIHDGLERSYMVHVPEVANSGADLPLLLNLHGFTGTSSSQMNYADFRPIAEREGFILVYPQGTLLGDDTHWNVGSWTRESTADDIGFLTALIDIIIEDFNIDESRVYSIGHSNGGYMSFQLACQIGDKITAVASISGTMTPENFNVCEPTHPTPVLQVHGTSDTVIPYNGAVWTKSVDDVLAFWNDVNQVDAEPAIIDIPQNPDSTALSTVQRLQYSSADRGVMVEHILVEGGGHEWPGQNNVVGQVNLDLDINEEIWAFLSQFDLDDLDG